MTSKIFRKKNEKGQNKKKQKNLPIPKQTYCGNVQVRCVEGGFCNLGTTRQWKKYKIKQNKEKHHEDSETDTIMVLVPLI